MKKKGSKSIAITKTLITMILMGTSSLAFSQNSGLKPSKALFPSFGEKPDTTSLYSNVWNLEQLIYNIAYTYQALSNGKIDGEILAPVVLLDGKAIEVQKLKDIPFSKVVHFEFVADEKANAIYGQAGTLGVFIIKTK